MGTRFDKKRNNILNQEDYVNEKILQYNGKK